MMEWKYTYGWFFRVVEIGGNAGKRREEYGKTNERWGWGEKVVVKNIGPDFCG